MFTSAFVCLFVCYLAGLCTNHSTISHKNLVEKRLTGQGRNNRILVVIQFRLYIRV